MESIPDFQTLMAFQQSQLYGFVLGDNKKEHMLGTFIFAAQRGIDLTSGDECNADIFLHGTDAGINAVFMQTFQGEINFINTQLVMLGNELTGIIASSYLFNANVSFFNTITWGLSNAPTTSIKGAGNILIQQLHTRNSDLFITQNNGLFITGGKVRIENVKISNRNNADYVIDETIKDIKIFGSYSEEGFVLEGSSKDNIEADYNYGQASSSSSGYQLLTGWEENKTENDWNNILWGNKNVLTSNNPLYLCRAEENADAHSGLRVLRIVGNKIDDKDSLFYKVFKMEVVVFDSTILSYWLNPKDESGRSTFVDLLFSDGSRFSELSPIANDGLPLTSARGTIGEWEEVICNIGEYAVGKKIQSLLIGTVSLINNKFESLIDDLAITAPLLHEPWEQIDVGIQYLGGYSIFEEENLFINSASRGLDPYEDKFVYVYQPIEGECEISAKVESITNPGSNPYVGVMIRESDSTLSRFVSIFYSPIAGVYTKWRTPSSNSVHTIVHRDESSELPKWLKVSRKGNEFNTYTSVDGIDWGTPLYHIIMDMDSTVMIGLATISGATASWMETEFSNVVVSDEVVSVENELSNLPETFQLYQNHPNPFNPSTSIKYDLSNSGMVSLSVYDVLGRKVAELINKQQSAGSYSVNWDASKFSSGIYFYRLEVTSPELKKEIVFTRKMILLK